MIDAGSRPIASQAVGDPCRAARRSASSETNGVLNSAAKRAASAGVRFGPPPPTMIGTPPACTGLGSAGESVTS